MSSPHDNTTYIIIPFAEVTQQMIDDCAETSFESLRHTLSGTDKIILKWIGDTPSSVSGYDQYSYSEILEEMGQPEWSGGEAESSSSSSSVE